MTSWLLLFFGCVVVVVVDGWFRLVCWLVLVGSFLSPSVRQRKALADVALNKSAGRG